MCLFHPHSLSNEPQEDIHSILYPFIAFVSVGPPHGEFRQMTDGLHWRRLDVAVTEDLTKYKIQHVVT